MDKNESKKKKKSEQWNNEKFIEEKYDIMALYKSVTFGGGTISCAGVIEAMPIS